MIKNLFVLFIFLTFSISGIPCDCYVYDISDKGITKAYASSELVFKADVFDIDTVNRTYKMKVLEVYKGAVRVSKIIESEQLENCPPHIKRTGIWIFFGGFESKTFKPTVCGMSFNMESPFVYPPPPPPHPNDSEATQLSSKETWFESKENWVNHVIVLLENMR